MSGERSRRGATLSLNGHDLTVSDVVEVAKRTGVPRLVLDPDALSRMRSSNRLKERLIEHGLPIYGVTTGFGDSNTGQVSADKSAELQRNLIHYHLNGVGPLTAPDVVRATMLIRANCLARGHSGVRSEVVALLLRCVEEDVLPVIPELGSVGASGDLVPLSYLAAALIGEGPVRHRGRLRAAGEALADRGLAPVALVAKEGLALINGTSYMSAFAALAVGQARHVAYSADLCTALAAQVLLGNEGHFDEFIHRHKPHPGQQSSARLVRALLAGSGLSQTQRQVLAAEPMPSGAGYHRRERSVQDRYSVRCAPGVTGVLWDTLGWVEPWVTIEINSSNDNPLFDADAEAVRSGGNFYGGHIAQAMDSLKLAVASVGDLLDRQLAQVVDEKLSNGLPPNLTRYLPADDRDAGLHHGFKGMQIAASALTAEALKLTAPASAFSRPTEALNQDKVSMGSIAARDARTVLELVVRVAAITLLALCQAADLRGADRLSPATRRAHSLVRARVPFLDRDRRMDGDIAEAADLIRSGRLESVSTGDTVATVPTRE